VFVFRNVSDTNLGTGDIITDFVPGADLIDLSQIDANGGLAGEGVFLFVTGIVIPLTQGSVQVVQDAGAGVTRVLIRIAGDTSVDAQIELTGLIALTAADFVL
jgi:hypothetical protein